MIRYFSLLLAAAVLVTSGFAGTIEEPGDIWHPYVYKGKDSRGKECKVIVTPYEYTVQTKSNAYSLNRGKFQTHLNLFAMLIKRDRGIWSQASGAPITIGGYGVLELKGTATFAKNHAPIQFVFSTKGQWLLAKVTHFECSKLVRQ